MEIVIQLLKTISNHINEYIRNITFLLRFCTLLPHLGIVVSSPPIISSYIIYPFVYSFASQLILVSSRVSLSALLLSLRYYSLILPAWNTQVLDS